MIKKLAGLTLLLFACCLPAPAQVEWKILSTGIYHLASQRRGPTQQDVGEPSQVPCGFGIFSERAGDAGQPLR